MHLATSSPVALYASLNGTPFFVSQSAQSVALINPPAAALRIFCGITLIVSSIGVKAVRHILTVSTASKIASLSSCISLLYARAMPFIIVSNVILSPKTLPLLPRTSSAISGFFFCGIIDEPVENASSSSMNLNSQLHHIMISSENLERCTIIIERTDANSMQ